MTPAVIVAALEAAAALVVSLKDMLDKEVIADYKIAERARLAISTVQRSLSQVEAAEEARLAALKPDPK